MKSQANSISWLSLINLGFAILGVAQALVVGRIFGISSAIEIYFAAAVIYQSIVKLTQTGQLLEIFTPLYHEVQASAGATAAHRFMAIFTNWLMLFVLTISVCLWLIAPFVVPIIVPGFDEIQLDKTISMFRWIIPLLVVKVLERAFASYLNAEKHFLVPELTKLIFVACGVVLILMLSKKFDAWAMIAALWCSVGGTLIADISFAVWYGYRHSFHFRDQYFQISKFLGRSPALLSYVGCTQVFTITLTATLTLLPSGSLALYTYANKLFSIARRLSQKPLAVVFLNHYSIAISNAPALGKKLTREAFRISLAINVLLTTLFITSGNLIIYAIWEGPRFPRSDAHITYLLAATLFMSLFLTTPALIYRKINISHQNISAQYFIASIAQLINAALAYAIIPQFHLPGVMAVLVANSLLIMTGNAMVLKVSNSATLRFYDLREFAGCMIVMVLSVTPAVVLQSQQITLENSVSIFLGTKLSLLTIAVLNGLVTLCLMYAFSRILRVEALNDVFRGTLKRFSKLRSKIRVA
ncbi:hypothetical protein OAL19_01680 [bacterium]|nr:hypothetical protein [bacterium]